MLAPAEVPRNASSAQIERPHQSGGNSANLVVSQVELRRIHLSRSWVNMGSGLFGRFVEVTDRAQPPLACPPPSSAPNTGTKMFRYPWPSKQTRKQTNAVFDG